MNAKSNTNVKTMTSSKIIEKPKNFSKSLKNLILFSKNESKRIILSSIFAFFASFFALFGPLLLGKITNVLHLSLTQNVPVDFQLISQIGIVLVIFYTISMISNYLQGFIMSKASNNIGKKMRSDIAQKINKLPLRYFDKRSVGDTMSVISNDISTISQTLSQVFSVAIISVVKVLGFLVVMFIISWQLTLITLFFLPLSFVVVSLITKKSQKYFIGQQKTLGELNGKAEESYSAHSVIYVFNKEQKVVEDFAKTNDKLAKLNQKSTFVTNIIQPITVFFTNLTYLIVCLVGANLVFENVILIGAIASFVLYIRQLNQPISQIASIVGTMQSTVACAERVFDLLQRNEESDEKDKQPLLKVGEVKGNVEFKNVCFGYEKTKEIIHNFNFVAHMGEKIAIVGPTGAGKTTLINLLMRFYEVDSGEILIDGVSVNDMRRRDLRKLFAMVLQDTWLFEGTVKDNVSYGSSKITLEEVEKACEFANIDHFIKTLPNGYNTILDDSANFSLGQRQLLTIARATLKNSPMLILDEATSSVDTRTEILIQNAMDKLTQNKTTFVIAHRLSTIKNANKIIVMKNGRILEVGNHEQLIEKNGFYAELYNSQFDD